VMIASMMMMIILVTRRAFDRAHVPPTKVF